MALHEYNNPDPLSPAKGTLIGVLLGAAIWVLIWLAYLYACPVFQWYMGLWGKLCA